MAMIIPPQASKSESLFKAYGDSLRGYRSSGNVIAGLEGATWDK
jgi:hypothetical protein